MNQRITLSIGKLGLPAFLFFIIAFAPFLAEAQSLSKAQLVEEWKRAKEYTLEYLNAMPEEGYAYQPTPEINTFAGQMLHLAGANYFFVSTALGTKNPYGREEMEKMTELKTKEGVIKFVMGSYDHVVSSINSMTEQQAAKQVDMFGNKMNAGLLFVKAFEHQTHHRGQTTIYLRMKGVTPPQEKLF